MAQEGGEFCGLGGHTGLETMANGQNKDTNNKVA